MPLSHVKRLEHQYLLGIYNRYDVLVNRGRGTYLFDQSNKRYLDLMAGIGVNALGYAHPRVIRLLRKQIKKPLHLSNLLYHEYQGRLAERLAGVSGLDRVFFTNSGTESVEGCLKFARVWANSHNGNKEQKARRYRVLALEGSFHGRTIGSLSATEKAKYREPFEPLVPGFEFVGFNDVADLERKFSDDVCAVIFETIQGEGGVRPVSEEFYRRARGLTRESGAALISDEIQCGLGRTGRWFAFHKFAPASDHENLPDLVSLAKPLGLGIPLGAVLMKEDVAKSIEAGTHGTTFGGGPLACRLSLELFKIFEDERILGHVQNVGAYFRQQLDQLSGLPVVKEVRGDGLMLALELTVAARPIVEKLLYRGFIVNCTRETVLRILPPLIITKKQIDKFVGSLRPMLEEIHD
jgi:acetylornithine aminotransferase/acetylornithine/N-succinyldiaminopimelate aminotransferase